VDSEADLARPRRSVRGPMLSVAKKPAAQCPELS